MKRFGNLYDRIISMDNLVLADKKARRGKKKNYGVKLFDEHREENLNLLRSILLNNAYHTSEYHTFTIYEPKERLIYRLPYFPDRIVHHAHNLGACLTITFNILSFLTIFYTNEFY